MNNFSNLYKNNINKEINNNKEYCYLNNVGNIESQINNLFKDISRIYKYKVSIKTQSKDYKTYLIGKTDDYLVTLNDEKIQIKDIISLEVIN